MKKAETSNTKTAVRDGRFELLRILAMLLILLQHPLERSMENGLPDVMNAPLSTNWIFASAVSIWGQLGVMLFVMISSWFMSDRQGIKGKKILMLFLQVWTTCLLMIAAAAVICPERLRVGLLIKEAVTPVFRRHYWFISAFLAFFISVPLLQKLVHALSDRALRNTCIVMTLLIPLYNCLDENVGGAWADFCYIFMVTAYLKRTPDNWFRRNCWQFLIGMAGITVCLIGCKMLFSGSGLLEHLLSALRGRTLPMFLVTIELFYCFEQMKPICSKAVNLIGSTMFGVYLIHENYLFRGEENGKALVWNEWLHIDQLFRNDPLFIGKYLLIVAGAFVICVLIELLRQNLIERWYRSSRLIERAGNRIDQFYSNQCA